MFLKAECSHTGAGLDVLASPPDAKRVRERHPTTGVHRPWSSLTCVTFPLCAFFLLSSGIISCHTEEMFRLGVCIIVLSLLGLARGGIDCKVSVSITVSS